jgi:redox-sensitive bicupin YhaK (pirin superfamily)
MGALKVTETILPRPKQAGMVGDGFRVYNYFPSGYRIRELISPFLMLDFNPEYNFGPSDHPRGVGAHPHKGFETVTIAYKGHVAHHDSKGNSGVIHPGDVQWMTAGTGIVHEEFHGKEFSKSGGNFELIQLWVNLPRKHKMTPPKYQGLIDRQFPRAPIGNAGTARIIAGSLLGQTGPATTFTPMILADLNLNQKQEWELNLPRGYSTTLFVLDGTFRTSDGRILESATLALFDQNHEVLSLETVECGKILLMAGEPIDEPVVGYGPFVMNTREEIVQAVHDYQAGKMGHLKNPTPSRG